WTDDQNHAVRIAVDDSAMPGGPERPRHGRLGRRHPLLELALLERDLAEACERLEDLLLAGRLEVLRDRPLERRLVLPVEPGHAVELFDSPRVAPRHARREAALLSLEQIQERIHVRGSSNRRLPFELLGTRSCQSTVRTMRKRAFPAII